MSRPVFSHPKYNGRQSNQGNTVLVNIGQVRSKSDLWCLGYLQDIEDEQALIDLDCTQFPPFWIGTRYVWYHHLLDFGSLYRDQLRLPPLHVHVALRDELDGPYIFRPAQLVNRPSCDNLYMCCLTIKEPKANEKDLDVIVVHHWQVIQSLPINEAPLFGRLRQSGSLDAIPVLKQMVHMPKIGKTEILPEHQMKSLVSLAVKRAGFGGHGRGLHPRVFVAIGKDDIMVLLFDLHLWGVDEGELGQREWTALSGQAFASEIGKCLESCNQKDELVPKVSGMVVFLGHAEKGEPSAGILPRELLSEVLISLDFHSQLIAKRVSSVWYLLLRVNPAWTVIDFSTISKGMYAIDASKGYSIGTLLNRAVSQKTKVLAVENIIPVKPYEYDDHVQIMEIIRNLLAIKQVELLAIMLKNCRFMFEVALTSRKTDDFMVHKIRHISRLLPVCKRLFLWNHTAVEIPGCDCGVIHGRVKSPPCLAVGFPLLEFRRSGGERESIMRYVQALEPQLPPVEEIKARFKERHQFFVETLPYPDEWQRFRQFLRRHTFTEHTSSDSFWNDLDLRNFDQLPLTKMALLPLDICIDSVFENVAV